MASFLKLKRAVLRELRLYAIDIGGEACASLKNVQFRTCLNGSVQIQRPRTKRIGQGEKDSTNFLALLLLESHDVVVDFDRAQRLQEQAGTARRGAMNDAGNGVAVL